MMVLSLCLSRFAIVPNPPAPPLSLSLFLSVCPSLCFLFLMSLNSGEVLVTDAEFHVSLNVPSASAIISLSELPSILQSKLSGYRLVGFLAKWHCYTASVAYYRIVTCVTSRRASRLIYKNNTNLVKTIVILNSRIGTSILAWAPYRVFPSTWQSSADHLDSNIF